MVSRILVDPHPPSWQGVVVHSCKKYLPTGSLVQSNKGIWDKCMKARVICLNAYDWPVEHGIECCNLIHTHRRDVDNSCNLVHYRDGGETILSLAEIKKRHNSRLLVLRRVALENFFNSLLVVLVEFKRNAGIVLGCVAMLYPKQYTEFVKTGWNDKSFDTLKIAKAGHGWNSYHKQMIRQGGGWRRNAALCSHITGYCRGCRSLAYKGSYREHDCEMEWGERVAKRDLVVSVHDQPFNGTQRKQKSKTRRSNMMTSPPSQILWPRFRNRTAHKHIACGNINFSIFLAM